MLMPLIETNAARAAKSVLGILYLKQMVGWANSAKRKRASDAGAPRRSATMSRAAIWPRPSAAPVMKMRAMPQF
jgi:hypothetical protein